MWGDHIAFSCHGSSVFSGLIQFLILCLFSRPWESWGVLATWRVPQSGFVWCFSRGRTELWVLGKDITEEFLLITPCQGIPDVCMMSWAVLAKQENFNGGKLFHRWKEAEGAGCGWTQCVYGLVKSPGGWQVEYSQGRSRRQALQWYGIFKF